MKHFLSIADLTTEELWRVLNLARELKEEWLAGGNKPLLRGKTLGMVFQKPSLRTRVSFEVAMIHLGGQALYLSPNEIQLGKRESVADDPRAVGLCGWHHGPRLCPPRHRGTGCLLSGAGHQWFVGL